MALDSLPFQNPWEVGGKYHNELPWVKDSQRFGFDYGNDYFEPKTQAEIREEGLLQMAILALVLAAPAIAGAVGGGAGGPAAGIGGGGSSGVAASMGASAQAGGAVTGQAAVAATGGGIAIGASGSAAMGAVGLALFPFLQSGATKQIQSKAKLGTLALKRFFNEVAPIHGQPFKEQFEWQSSLLHPAMQLLDDLLSDPVPSQAFLSQSRIQTSTLSAAFTSQVISALEKVVVAPAPFSPVEMNQHDPGNITNLGEQVQKITIEHIP